jgi:hypothetical protein
MSLSTLIVLAMKKSIFIQILLVVFFALPAFSQIQNDSIGSPFEAADTLQQDFGLFTNEEVLKLSLRFDITQYTRKKPKEEYLKGVLTYFINDKDSINREIRLKSRGEFRNGFCDFPPIRLNFKKAGFQKEDLKKIETIKLVTHCKYGNEENLLKEYLIYKLYNVLTDNSFKVRLVQMNYINTSKKSKPIKAYAFLIEPLDLLAERTKSIPVSSVNLSQKNIIPEMMDRAAIFNYMIGNTDWSVPNQHNCKVLSIKNYENPQLGMIVPYDFDYSGFVNADYAVPYEGLSIKSVRERLYLGICRSEEVFQKELKEFSDKKEAFYKIINDFTLLSERSRKDIIYFLDQFYSEFDKKNSIVNELRSNCKNY